jgi:signal transduction histidine kinase
LRRDVLVQKFIPAIVGQYFGPDGQRDYHIWIAPENGKGVPIYASSPSAALTDFSDADVREDISGTDWILAARHEAGSVETFISQYRRRNLSLGFGTVLVLGASFVFLVVATRRAQWLAERQMEFVAGVSHELRTPIAGISSLSQNLADGVVTNSGHVARYGQSINHESRRLKDMVDKVLHFSAVQSGQQRYVFEPVDLVSVVERELESLERTAGEGQPLPSFSAASDLPPVLGDEQALRSVVRNLVSNAMKFGNGDARVAISARRVDSPKAPQVELSVEDHGEGIAASDMPHIFDPFYRGKGARAQQAGGSGLGLSLVREIVKSHRGRVDVSSEPGRGSTFRVYLPVAEEAHGGSV